MSYRLSFHSCLVTCLLAISSVAEVRSEDLKIGKLPVKKILFLGNSITLHGPAPKIGWEGNWGMAATSQEKDFVHLLTAKIAKEAGGKPEVKIKNIADFERQPGTYDVPAGLKDELAFQPDLIVIAIGENVAALNSDEAKATFKMAFVRLVQELKKQGQPTILVRSSFWANPAKDEILQTVCQDAGGTFVDNRQLGADEANYARSERKLEHAGVAAHPGDKGMQAIADALWLAIQKQGSRE
jgi:lysophospholipase L1-like esterase